MTPACQKQPKLSTLLRKAVKESASVYAVASGSGVTYANLMHFVSGDHELTQREIDSLVAFFPPSLRHAS